MQTDYADVHHDIRGTGLYVLLFSTSALQCLVLYVCCHEHAHASVVLLYACLGLSGKYWVRVLLSKVAPDEGMGEVEDRDPTSL